MIINTSVPDISNPILTGGAAALFASICLQPMYLVLYCIIWLCMGIYGYVWEYKDKYGYMGMYFIKY